MANGNTLVSLAMLKVNADVGGADYIDYLRPFVAHALSKINATSTTVEEVHAIVRQEFGLLIPRRAIEIVLGRLGRSGLVERRDRAFVIHASRLHAEDLTTARSEALRRENVVVNALTAFANRHNASWTADHAVKALLEYLQQFSIECLRTYTQGSALPVIEQSPQSSLYFVNAFIRDAHDTSTSLFSDVMVLVQGQMLANALLCGDLDGAKQKFQDVVFYLDTPFVLDLIALQGAEPAAAARELVELLRRLRGELRVFEHTFQEIDGVLRAAEVSFGSPNSRSRVVSEARNLGKTASDLALLRGRLETLLLEQKVQRVRTPGHVAAYEISEEALRKTLEEKISYLHESAVLYDIDSIRSIYTLRKGKAPTRLENAAAILVTTNAQLARVAFDFGKNHEASREVSTVIADFSLVNIAWLKAPLGAPDLPEIEVLATCYAGMLPSPVMWVKYLAEIDKLQRDGKITPDDHQLLRFSLRAQNELMSRTGGSVDALSGRTVEEIAESVRAELVHDKDQMINAQAEMLSGAETELRKMREEALALRARAAERRKRAFWVADRIALSITVVATMAMLAVVLIAAINLPLERVLGKRLINSVPRALINSTASVIAFGGVVFTIGSSVWGWSVMAVASRFREKLRGWFYAAALWALMEDGDTPPTSAPVAN